MPRNKLSSALMLSTLAAVAGCGSSDFSKAEQAINSALKKNPSCIHVKVEVPIDKAKILDGGAIQVLLAKGLIAEGVVKQHQLFGAQKDTPGYVFTENGKEFVVVKAKNGPFPESPCVSTGNFEVSKIEAVDYGADADGKSIANVRASLRFSTATWLAETKTSPAWEKHWANVQEEESAKFMYRLIKSGDELFVKGRPEKLN